MAVLTTSARKRMPQSSFAGPNKSFPDNDIGHARKIFQLGPRSVRAGNISQGQLDRIEAKARKKFPSVGAGKKKKSTKKRSMPFIGGSY